MVFVLQRRSPSRWPNRRLFTFLTVLLVWTSSSSWGNQLFCSEMFSTYAFRKLESVNIVGNLDHPVAKQFIVLIESIRILTSKLKMPDSAATQILFDFENFGESSFDFETRKVELKRWKGSNGPVSLSDRELLGDTLHEVMHSFFYANMEVFFPEYQVVAKVSRTERVRLILENKLDEAEKTLIPTADLAGGFDELFADTGTVLLTNDPTIISDGVKKSLGYEYGRDFSKNISTFGWNVGSLLGLKPQIHRLFDPVRYMIWQKYLLLQKTSQQDMRPIILAAVMNASIDILTEFKNRRLTYGEWTVYDQGVLNEQLAERILFYLRG